MRKPFVFVNVAASVDGKISDDSRKRIEISCEEDLFRVDRLRAFSDGILVGIGTILSDNPSLTIKSEFLKSERVRNGKPRNPLRIVVDSKLRIPPNARVLDEGAQTLVATTEIAKKDLQKMALLRKRARVEIFGDSRVKLKDLCRFLSEIGIERLMVEGGGTLIRSMLKEKLVDEINIYYGNMVIAGKDAPTIADGTSFDPPINLELINLQRIGSGVYTRWKVIY
jgi:2,5-diamino-6-(ribosylamino)-4(3H)-pyrimidinone 5'-phosphate reductase